MWPPVGVSIFVFVVDGKDQYMDSTRGGLSGETMERVFASVGRH